MKLKEKDGYMVVKKFYRDMDICGRFHTSGPGLQTAPHHNI